ncbi:SDR family oxidoreductase [Corynebacterium glyciniphilum]|uniref:SDR family oxidoreductase n=1 Tax=Corynebacterium glyciniphilum TaxID=1404244 RepID=UPI003FD07D62
MAHETETPATGDSAAPGTMTRVLVIGASGSVGHHAVDAAVDGGYATTALVRNSDQASMFPDSTRVVVGEPTSPGVLVDALDGVTGVVFTQGTYSNDDGDAEQANYRPVHAVLNTLASPVRIALMSALAVTKPSVGHAWKRRGERLVRASGLPYTIVRPGWFDYNEPDEHRLVMLQGDTRWTGSPEDGVISRRQIADVLVGSLSSSAADHKTFELVAEKGDVQADLTPVFEALRSDVAGASVDGVLDRDTLPLGSEPDGVLTELDAVRTRF